MAIWRASVEEGTSYLLRAARTGATPLSATNDVLRWWSAMSDRSEPEWASPNEIVLETPIARLRDFSTAPASQVVPTLVLPPQAGHSSTIVDFNPHQSQVKAAEAAGLDPLYACDWLGATAATRDTTVEDYIAFLDQAVAAIGAEKVNLVGDCQGGWLATVWAALRPDRVNTLTIAGAPIDFHAGGGAIIDWLDLLTPNRDLSFYEGLVASGGGLLRGEYMLGGFIAMRPESEVEKQLALLTHLDDERYVDRYRAFEDWYKHTQDIAGAFYLWIVEHLFLDNQLVRGELVVGGERVDLGRIECPLYLLAGATDHITPGEQVYALAKHAGTPPLDITLRTTSGGHLGLFMGREALTEHWPPIFADIAQRSAAPVDKGTAIRRSRAQTPKGGRPVPAP
jgi:poly(3-hydroxyalkanoate) synthetase